MLASELFYCEPYCNIRKSGKNRYQVLRVERTDCEDVYVSGHMKCDRYEHVEKDVLSIE